VAYAGFVTGGGADDRGPKARVEARSAEGVGSREELCPSPASGSGALSGLSVALVHTHLLAPIYRRNKIHALRNYKIAIFTVKKHKKQKNEQKNKPTIVQSADMVTLPKRVTGTTASIVLPVAYVRSAQFLYGCPYRRLDRNMTERV
jgi:hypothetical protein